MLLIASAEECAALARRFALAGIDRLDAELTLARTADGAEGRGQIQAAIIQNCAISGEDFAVTIAEPVFFRFVPAAAGHPGDEEIEIAADDCDEIEYDGSVIDVGEAVAQSLALAIDPFATGPGAEEARRKAGLLGEGEAGPFGALKGLLGKE